MSEFYKHGYEQGKSGHPIHNEYELPEHKLQFEEGWFIGICDHLEELFRLKKLKSLDKKQ